MWAPCAGQEVLAYVRAHPELVQQATDEVYGTAQVSRPAPPRQSSHNLGACCHGAR